MLVQNHSFFLLHPFLTVEKNYFPPIKDPVIRLLVSGVKERLLKRFLVVFPPVTNSFFNIKHPPHENFIIYSLHCTLYFNSFSNSSRI